jgi:predicted Zn-dependent protease
MPIFGRAPASIRARPTSCLRIRPRPSAWTNAKLNARQYAAPAPALRERSEYLALLDGLIYGEDPSEGFVRGRRFLHPKLGFTFTAPDGFSLENTAQAVFGIKDGGEQALRLDVVRVPAEQALADYLVSGWIENIDPKSVEGFHVSGFPAATGDRDRRPMDVPALRDPVRQRGLPHHLRGQEPHRGGRPHLPRFDQLPSAACRCREMQSAKPLRLQIVTVRAGDTVERLARRMAVADRHAERFRVLNGLAPNARVKPATG